MLGVGELRNGSGGSRRGDGGERSAARAQIGHDNGQYREAEGSDRLERAAVCERCSFFLRGVVRAKEIQGPRPVDTRPQALKR